MSRGVEAHPTSVRESEEKLASKTGRYGIENERLQHVSKQIETGSES